MRTDEEILARIEKVKHRDFIGTEVSDLIGALSFESAKQFLKEGITEDQWNDLKIDTKEKILAKMEEYMPFAWNKANNCRGLSAGRSMSHYMAWTWLIGDDFGDLTRYEYYGKDNLVKLCEHYGWDHTQLDDGIRSNTEY